MGKNKLKRFAELETMERVFQPGVREPVVNFFLQGKWNGLVFHNEHPIVAELGCGRGEYTTNMAMMVPGKNFIGIDKKGARLWKGAKTANEENILNAAFLRIPIEQLHHYFLPGEIDEIWITFPDPQPQKTRENTRMTSPRFLEMYKSLLPPNGIVHLKTDNPFLFDYTLEKVKEMNCNIKVATQDLYNEIFTDEILSITTTYEKRYLAEGIKICYLRFSF
ncbi:MAG: tRNA (guanosine(46)-N7)-methyltransferase TrmB [Bacteroidota bacterium]|nr:tRNA (guanosine(46)-N7)-methyltransferase TrmB [Bacteroidota bacterium]